MNDGDALRSALDIFYLPSQVRMLRSQPLPKGTNLILRLAAGDADAASEAQLYSDRPPCARRQAAIFFIEQILLDPQSDEYRMLGLDQTASLSELRAHMALLLKGLHPDLGNDNHRSQMARRVIDAWTKINTAERRATRNATPGDWPSHAETMVPILIRRPLALLPKTTDLPENKSSRRWSMQRRINIAGGARKIRWLWKRIVRSQRANVADCKD